MTKRGMPPYFLDSDPDDEEAREEPAPQPAASVQSMGVVTDGPDGYGEWRTVPGFYGVKVSSLGYYCNLRRKMWTKPSLGYITVYGYRRCGVNNGVKLVHSLVCLAFYGLQPEATTCDHINRNRSDNRVTNLRWATHAQQSSNKGKSVLRCTSYKNEFEEQGNLLGEEWKLSSFGFLVSNMGRTQLKHPSGSLRRRMTPKVVPNKGYAFSNGKRVHRVVWQTFVGPIPAGKTVDHINRCTGDNRLSNLRLATTNQQRVNQDRSGVQKSKFCRPIRVTHPTKGYEQTFDSVTDAVNSLATLCPVLTVSRASKAAKRKRGVTHVQGFVFDYLD
jgi:hypothetical protein